MPKAVTRSVSNVLVGNFGDVAIEQHGEIKGRIKSVEASDAAVSMRYASKVIMVPGNGLAAAQAQHGLLYGFVELLQAAPVEFNFAVHPVASRTPSDMHVLLAEADVPYKIIHELDDISGKLSARDLALIIGASGVLKPAMIQAVKDLKGGSSSQAAA